MFNHAPWPSITDVYVMYKTSSPRRPARRIAANIAKLPALLRTA
jgi:hypothetical protein